MTQIYCKFLFLADRTLYPEILMKNFSKFWRLSMSGIKELTRLMRELDDQLRVCMRCGMCQAVCPLYAETGLESDVARGKLALLEGLVHQLFKDPKGVNDRLNKCLLCGSWML